MDRFASVSLFDRVAATLPNSNMTGAMATADAVRSRLSSARFVQQRGLQQEMDEEMTLHDMNDYNGDFDLDVDAHDELVMDRLRSQQTAVDFDTIEAAYSQGGAAALARCTDYISAVTLCIDQRSRSLKGTRSIPGASERNAIVATATTGAAVADDVLAALRQERQLWRLLGLLLGGYVPSQMRLVDSTPPLSLRAAASPSCAPPASAPFCAGASLPADSTAQAGRVGEAMGRYDPSHVLAIALLQWLQVSAVDDLSPSLVVHSRQSMGRTAAGDGDGPGPRDHDSVQVQEDEQGYVVFSGTGRSQPAPALYDLPLHELWSLLRCGMAEEASARAQGWDMSQHPTGALLAALLASNEEAVDDLAAEEAQGAMSDGPSPRAPLATRMGTGAVSRTRRAAAHAAKGMTGTLRALLLMVAGMEGLDDLLADSDAGVGPVRTWEDRLWVVLHAHVTVAAPIQWAKVWEQVGQGGKGGAYGKAVMALTTFASQCYPACTQSRRVDLLSTVLSQFTPALCGLLGVGGESLPLAVFRAMSKGEQASIQATHPVSPASSLWYAVEFNRQGEEGPGQGPGQGGSSGMPFGPLSPDALPTTAQALHAAQVPLLRWAAHALLLLRTASPLSGHPLLQRTEAGGGGPLLPAADDVLCAYARHLACAQPRTAHILSFLELVCRMSSSRRAVRALVTYLLALPYTGTCRHEEEYGGVTGCLAAGTGREGADVPPRAVFWAAFRQLISNPATSSLVRDRVGAALRLAALTAITMDTGTVQDVAQAGLAAGVSHAGKGAYPGHASPSEVCATPADGLAVLGLALPTGGQVPLAARAAGITLVDYYRVTATQLLTGGTSTALLPGAFDNYAVWAANALCRLLYSEVCRAEEVVMQAGGGGGGRHVQEQRAVIHSAWATMRLLHFGLGSTASAAPDASSSDLVEALLPWSVVETQAALGASQEVDVPGVVKEGAAELASWRALIQLESAWAAWQEQISKAPPSTSSATSSSALPVPSSWLGSMGSSVAGALGLGSAALTEDDMMSVEPGTAARARALHVDVVRSRWSFLRLASERVLACALAALAPPRAVLVQGEGQQGPDAASAGWMPGHGLGASLLLSSDPCVTLVSQEEGHAIPEAGECRRAAVRGIITRMQEVVGKTEAWVQADPVAKELLAEEVAALFAPARHLVQVVLRTGEPALEGVGEVPRAAVLHARQVLQA